jgi:transcription-repair coupling factor (superfamily II helicase)
VGVKFFGSGETVNIEIGDTLYHRHYGISDKLEIADIHYEENVVIGYDVISYTSDSKAVIFPIDKDNLLDLYKPLEWFE